jgi:hypothetical protein
MKYEVWTKRALLVWVPFCLMLGLLPPVASVVAMVNGRDLPWHFVMTCALMPAVMLLIVWRRHDLHARRRDSIVETIAGGAWLVVDVPYMSKEEILAVEAGLVQAQHQCAKRLGSTDPYKAHDRLFVHVQPEVIMHWGKRRVKVGGLTYPTGGMAIEYTTNLALLQDRARHEGCHAILNRTGRLDWTGNDHHQKYPELFR